MLGGHSRALDCSEWYQSAASQHLVSPEELFFFFFFLSCAVCLSVHTYHRYGVHPDPLCSTSCATTTLSPSHVPSTGFWFLTLPPPPPIRPSSSFVRLGSTSSGRIGWAAGFWVLGNFVLSPWPSSFSSIPPPQAAGNRRHSFGEALSALLCFSLSLFLSSLSPLHPAAQREARPGRSPPFAAFALLGWG